MTTDQQTSKVRLWTSYILQGLIVLLFFMGAAGNIFQSEDAITGATDLGYPESSVLCLGIVLLASTLLYAIPKTTIIGAVLLTGWLGGAVATHVIHEDPMLNIFLPVIFGIVIWLALWLRMPNLQRVFPLVSKS
ncbi:DoxX family protein [Flagellimonas sp. 2504JD4-2]